MTQFVSSTSSILPSKPTFTQLGFAEYRQSLLAMERSKGRNPRDAELSLIDYQRWMLEADAADLAHPASPKLWETGPDASANHDSDDGGCTLPLVAIILVPSAR